MILTISKAGASTVSVGGSVGVLQAGRHTATYDLTIDELEAIRSKLVHLQAAGLITWSTSPTTASADNAAEGATVALTGGGGDRANDMGSFASVAAMPNGSGAPGTPPHPGDRCFLTSTGVEYLCISGGTVNTGDAVWSPNTGQGPWSSVLYVDQVRGIDATGQRGNMNRPYATIQAALNAMTTDDVVKCAPQRFSLTAALTIPATVIRCILDGTSGGFANNLSSTTGIGTIINSTVDAINLGANLGLTRCTISNMAIRTANAANASVRADGSSYAASSFISSGLTFENVSLTALGTPIFAKYVGNLRFFNCPFISGGVNVTIQNCFSVTFIQSQSLTMGWAFTYDITDPLTTQFQPFVNIQAGSTIGTQAGSGTITIGGQTRLYVDQSSSTGAVQGSTTVPLAVSASPAAAPGVGHCGYMANASVSSLDFASAGKELPDTATALGFDFRGCRFYTNGGTAQFPRTDVLQTMKFKVGGAGTNAQTVRMDGSVWMAGIGAPTCTADVNVHIIARGAQWPDNTIYTTPGASGDIIPPRISGTIDLSSAVGAKTWVQLGYAGFVRAGAAPDAVFYTPKVAGADAAATGSTTGITFGGNVVGTNNAANWAAIWK